jgi:DNA-binding protein WhiA
MKAMENGTVSFAYSVKEELLVLKKDEKNTKAQLSAIMKNSGTLIMRQNQYILKMDTENVKLAKYVFIEIKKYYNVIAKITVSQSMKLYKKYLYTIEIRDKTITIMTDLQLYRDNRLVNHPDKEFLKNDEFVRSYFSGIFLACGSVNSPENSNYHLEMALNDEEYAKYISKLAKTTFQLEFKTIKRRSNFVVYIKKSDKIVDFLIVIGATNSMFYFEDLRSTRDIKNSHNRLNNCLIANEIKSLENSKEQIKLFKLIDAKIGIKNLEDRLKDVAYLRIENEEASLSELADLYVEKTGIKISKSGINHRLKDIEKIAKNLNHEV